MYPDEEYTVAVTTQALLTGTYFATFLLCLRWLVFSDDGGTLRKRINWPFLIITVILFAFAVTEFSISFQSMLLAFEGENIGFYLIVLNVSDSRKFNPRHQVELSLQGVIDMLSYIITDSVLVRERTKQITLYSQHFTRSSVVGQCTTDRGVSSFFPSSYCCTTYQFSL